MFNRIKGIMTQCLCYRALELARERRPGEAMPRTAHHVLPGDTLPDLVRYPASHSSGPPHVGAGPLPPCPSPVRSGTGTVRLCGRARCASAGRCLNGR